MIADRALPDRLNERLNAVRRLSQSCLAKLALTTGISSSESFLLLNDRLWGVRFSIGSYCARWEISGNEILIYDADKLLDRMVLAESENRQVA